MWQDLQKFSTFSTSLQHLWNKLTTECHVKAPFSLFLTVICSQGIDSRLWTESGWQSLAVLLGSEHCLFWPTSWSLLFFYFSPFLSIFSGTDYFSQVKSSDQKNLEDGWGYCYLVLMKNPVLSSSLGIFIIQKENCPFHIWTVSFCYFA